MKVQSYPPGQYLEAYRKPVAGQIHWKGSPDRFEPSSRPDDPGPGRQSGYGTVARAMAGGSLAGAVGGALFSAVIPAPLSLVAAAGAVTGCFAGIVLGYSLALLAG